MVALEQVFGVTGAQLYGLEPLPHPEATDPQIQTHETMDQNKFNEMFKVAMTAHQKELQDNDCGEWSREAREWAIRVGLFAGNGTTADGQPNYMWASPLTREQAAQLFYRFAQDHGLA